MFKESLPAARWFLLLAAVSAGAAVAFGALSAHALSDLPARQLQILQTAVQYQWWHSLALALAGLWLLSATERCERLLIWAGLCFLGGILAFSGSLYLLALGGPGWVGPVTPLGGLLFIAGWLSLALAAWRLR